MPLVLTHHVFGYSHQVLPVIRRNVVSTSPLDGPWHPSPRSKRGHGFHQANEVTELLVWQKADQYVHVIRQLCVTKNPHSRSFRSTGQGGPDVPNRGRVDAPDPTPGAPHDVGVHLIGSVWSHGSRTYGILLINHHLVYAGRVPRTRLDVHNPGREPGVNRCEGGISSPNARVSRGASPRD